MRLLWPVEMDIIPDKRYVELRTAKGEATVLKDYHPKITLSGVVAYSRDGVILVEWDGSIREASGYIDPLDSVWNIDDNKGTLLFFDGELKEYSGELFGPIEAEDIDRYDYILGAPGYYVYVSSGLTEAMLPLDSTTELLEPGDIEARRIKVLSSDNVLIELEGGERITLSGAPLRLFRESNKLVLHARRGFAEIPAGSPFEVVGADTKNKTRCKGYSPARCVVYAVGDVLVVTDGKSEDRIRLPDKPVSLTTDSVFDARVGDRAHTFASVEVLFSSRRRSLVYIDTDDVRFVDNDEVRSYTFLRSYERGSLFESVSPLLKGRKASCVSVDRFRANPYTVALVTERSGKRTAYLTIRKKDFTNDVKIFEVSPMHGCTAKMYASTSLEQYVVYKCGSLKVSSLLSTASVGTDLYLDGYELHCAGYHGL